MTASTRFMVLLAATGLAISSLVAAQDAQPAAPAQQTVQVKGAAEKPHRVAPSWDQSRTYKFRDLVNYDGWVFQAESGSAHKRPNVNSDDGWVKLNPCDDQHEGAVLCEIANQARTTDAQTDAQKEYERVKQDMQKGKPANRPEG
jgi:hypothetical protein